MEKDFGNLLAPVTFEANFQRYTDVFSECLKSVFTQNYDQSRVPLAKLRSFFGPNAYRIFGEIFNARWLNARNHEYGQHGVSNTFKFWTSEEKQIFLQNIQNLTSMLVKNDVACIVCFGTLLGPVRDGGFIPHDDDADILCFNFDNEYETNAFVEKLLEVGTQAGMKIVKIHDGNAFIRMFTPTGKSIDFFICDVKNSVCHLHPAKHKPTEYDVIFPIQTGNILGVEVPFPNKPKDLLNNIYGEGWTTPTPFFVHNWNRK